MGRVLANEATRALSPERLLHGQLTCVGHWCRKKPGRRRQQIKRGMLAGLGSPSRTCSDTRTLIVGEACAENPVRTSHRQNRRSRSARGGAYPPWHRRRSRTRAFQSWPRRLRRNVPAACKSRRTQGGSKYCSGDRMRVAGAMGAKMDRRSDRGRHPARIRPRAG